MSPGSLCHRDQSSSFGSVRNSGNSPSAIPGRALMEGMEGKSWKEKSEVVQSCAVFALAVVWCFSGLIVLVGLDDEVPKVVGSWKWWSRLVDGKLDHVLGVSVCGVTMTKSLDGFWGRWEEVLRASLASLARCWRVVVDGGGIFFRDLLVARLFMFGLLFASTAVLDLLAGMVEDVELVVLPGLICPPPPPPRSSTITASRTCAMRAAG